MKKHFVNCPLLFFIKTTLFFLTKLPRVDNWLKIIVFCTGVSICIALLNIQLVIQIHMIYMAYVNVYFYT